MGIFEKKQNTVSQKWTTFLKIKSFFYRFFIQWIIIRKNKNKKHRFLEIGPGEYRIKDFETLGIIKTKNVDYVADIMKKINFPNETFDLIYASHVLEHVPWYLVEKTIKEWARIIKKDGVIELWVPDALKISKAFCDFEFNDIRDFENDGWYRFNEEKDANKWFSGRMFSYGDGLGTRGHFNFHLSSFSERYLKKILQEAGFKDIKTMSNNECRGYDHGWINLGIRGIKK